MTACPCNPEVSYDACCQPYHGGTAIPETAEQLMRSRYSAFALGLADYLISTMHREHPQYQKNTVAWRRDLTAYCRDTQFHGLTIREHTPGETESTVAFEVRMSHKGHAFTLVETSRFRKAGKRWLYHSGEPQVAE